MLRSFIRGVLATGVVLLPLQAAAQDAATGRIIGRVVNAANAAPVSQAQVFVAGTSIGVLSDLNGRYVLHAVPAGSVDVTVQVIGYATKTVTGVTVAAGEVTTLDVSVDESAVEITGITISAEREAGSNAALLDQRRTAPSLVESVGAADIARRPDSDAADVAKRMTGVTVADDKYVFVRGLGERYSQTSLNGSSLPSPEPEKEVVPLDLFPSGFLESLQTQKSYTPDLPADFSGGAVQIQTKDFPNRFTVRLGMSTSFNTVSQFQDGFLSYDGGGRDWLGLDDGTRAQPDVMERIMGDVRSGERLPSDAGQLVEIGQALQNASPTFAPSSGDTPLNRSFDASVGGSTAVFDDGEVGFFAAGTYSDKYTLREGEIERKWRAEAFVEPTADISTPNVDYEFTKGTREVSWGTIGNVTLKPNPNQKISLRTTVNLNTDDEARMFTGNNDEDIGGDIRNERARFVERLMLWGQLSGEHLTFMDSRLDWRVSAARAKRDEPFMRETIYLEDDGEYFLLDFTESARYFFSELVDDDVSAGLDWEFPFEFGSGDASIKFGGAYRNRTRDFGSRRLNWNFLGNTIADLDAALDQGSVTASNPDELNEFRIDEVVEPGDVYGADDERVAGYLMVTVPVTEKLEAIAGARVETYDLVLTSRGEDLNNLSQTDFAPSINLTYSASDNVKIRAAGSRTLDRPEFRELAPFQFTEATSLRQLVGNPLLVPAEIVSADLRIDWFPGPGEIISFGGFMKDMTSPIEQVFIAAASSAYSFQNALDGQVFGLEFDVQLAGRRFSEALEHVSLSANLSVIESEVNVRAEGIYQPTNLTRPLEGQAPYVLNTGINYASPSGFEAGLFYNRFGERLTAAGGSGLPDIFEQPRNALDATVAFPLVRGARAKVKATNLLDQDYTFLQAANGFERVQRQYSVGRTISVGLSWEFN